MALTKRRDITIYERKDEYLYVKYLQEQIANYIGSKDLGNFSAFNPQVVEPEVILAFTRDNLFSKGNNKIMVLYCNDLKDLDRKLEGKGKKTLLMERLFEVLDNNKHIKIIVAVDSINKKNTWYKKINDNGKVIEYKHLYDREYIKFIRMRCKHRGIDIDEKTAKAFYNKIGNSCSILNNEIEKVSLLNIDKIDKKIIDENVIPCYKNIAYELLEAISDRKAHKALRIIDNLLMNGTNVFQIFALIYRNMLILLYIKCNCDLSEMKIHEYVLKKYKMQAKQYTEEQIINILNSVMQFEKDVKTGVSKNHRLMLYSLILQIV